MKVTSSIEISYVRFLIDRKFGVVSVRLHRISDETAKSDVCGRHRVMFSTDGRMHSIAALNIVNFDSRDSLPREWFLVAEYAKAHTTDGSRNFTARSRKKKTPKSVEFASALSSDERRTDLSATRI